MVAPLGNRLSRICFMRISWNSGGCPDQELASNQPSPARKPVIRSEMSLSTWALWPRLSLTLLTEKLARRVMCVMQKKTCKAWRLAPGPARVGHPRLAGGSQRALLTRPPRLAPPPKRRELAKKTLAVVCSLAVPVEPAHIEQRIRPVWQYVVDRFAMSIGCRKGDLRHRPGPVGCSPPR